MKLIILLFFAVAIRLSDSAFPLNTWHVHVVNGLSHNKMMFLRCQSKDDDLGEHNLTAGAEFSWKFKNNFFERTRFWCYKHADFDVFWCSDDLYYRCNYKNCTWIPKDDGIYIKNIPEKYDEPMHKWEQGLMYTD
ncbi:hypothetical protein Pint_01603 [Pistacia integerrima]|uniref:Uncharacterized protein n=1 Tax=Pistacia integerrima TaxID=434235 RepID=A0ACC0ZJZ8_9ROSI|nr:hypothetical protein Pint_01603 [Pistacia integerrima]